MSINWNEYPSIIYKTKLHKALRKLITEQNYKDGIWTLTDVIADDDARKFTIYKILEGIRPNGEKRYDMAPRITFKFEVITRQACCRDAKGNTLWQSEEALALQGAKGDSVPKHDEKPIPGDVIEWKGHAITVDEDTDRPVDAKILKKWARMGKRPNEYLEFEVDRDGCISVNYPTCLEMLSRKGFKGAKPQFRKTHIKDKRRRRLTNWWFREIPPGQQPKRKKRSDAGKSRGAKDEAPMSPTE